MRCVVTGGSGFIGSHLCRALVDAGHEVTSIDLKVRPSQDEFAPSPLDWCEGVRYVLADVRSDEAAEHLARAEVVYHLAAQRSVQRSLDNPKESMTWNVECMLAVLQGAPRGARIVTASSSSVYGPNLLGRESRESDLLAPCSPYAASKVACEALCESWFRSFGASIISLRYFNVYGPGQSPAGDYATVIPRFVRAALRRERAEIYGGEQSRAFTYVDDVVRATLLAGEWKLESPGKAGAMHQVLNVGSAETTSIQALARLVSQTSLFPLETECHPARQGEALVTLPCLERVQQVLGWRPVVGLAEGLGLVFEGMQPFDSADEMPTREHVLAAI